MTDPGLNSLCNRDYVFTFFYRMSKHFIEEVFLVLGCKFYMWLINSCIVLLFSQERTWHQ